VLVSRRELREGCGAKGSPGSETRVQVAATRNLGYIKNKQAGGRSKIPVFICSQNASCIVKNN